MLKDYWKYINKPTTSLWQKLLILFGVIWSVLVILAIGLWLPWALLGFPIWQAAELVHDREDVGLFEVASTVQPLILEGLKAVLPSLSGVGLSAAAIVALLNFRVTQDKQVTDLFVKATEMLGHERLEVRIGGIYSLERIAKNSDRDHWTVMEVLAAFIQKTSDGEALSKARRAYKEREHKQTGSKLDSADIQAALRVIGRRDVTKDPSDGKPLSLFGANLSGVVFEEEADFRRTYLVGAVCRRAFLIKARFDNVDLSYANLRTSRLTGASFIDAQLLNVDLRKAYLEYAVFTGANLEGTDLREVEGGEAAQIVAAKNWWLAKYDDEFSQELTAFAQKQAEHDPKFAEQLRLFEQNRQTQNSEPEDPSDTPG